MHQGVKGADHEPGADEQDQGKRDLHDNQGLTGAMPFPALAKRTATLAETAVGICPRIFEDGDKTDEQTGEEAEAEGEKQHGEIDANVMDAGKTGGRHRHQKAQCTVGQCQPDQAARNSEDEALQEQLGRDASPASTQGRTNGQFLTTPFDPDQQQIGNVCASDQQNQNDRAHQNPQDIAYVTDNVLLERAEIGREPHFFKNADAESLRGGEAAQDHGKEPRHICAGLFHGDSGLEAGKRALTEVAEFGFIAIPLERQEERDIRLIEKVESLGQDAR